MCAERPTTRVAPQPSLFETLTVAQRVLSRGLALALSEEGATVDQWRVMRSLADGSGHLMGELAETLLIPHPSLTRIMDGLVDASLVYRRQSTTDRRKVAVHLSRRGYDYLAHLDALAAAHEQAVRSSPEWRQVTEALRLVTTPFED